MLILLAIGAVWVTGVACLIIDSWAQTELNNWSIEHSQTLPDHPDDEDFILGGDIYDYEPTIEDQPNEEEMVEISEEDSIIDIDDLYIDLDTNMELDDTSGEIVEKPIDIDDILLDNMTLDLDGSVIDIDLENI